MSGEIPGSRRVRAAAAAPPIGDSASDALGAAALLLGPRRLGHQLQEYWAYYGAFYRSGLHTIAWRIDQHLVRWAMQKYKRLLGRTVRAWAWLEAVRQHQPKLFAHWHLITRAPIGL